MNRPRENDNDSTEEVTAMAMAQRTGETAPNHDRGTILVVDDEPGMRLALREVLRRAGWRVVLAESAQLGLEELDALSEARLVITDFRMPGKTGLELLRELRRQRPTLPLVMMTAYGTVEDAVAAMREGAADYLLKPFSMETVLEIVDRVLSAPPVEAIGAPTSAKAEPDSSKIGGEERLMIAESPGLRRVLDVVWTVATADSTVLLTGESGTGKEVLARAVHKASGRRGPFVAVNCAALPEGLLESELFGHEKGAFTGAVLNRKGRFEQANGGTLLLDEISEMPLALQAKLLRVLQEREISPVGSTENVKLDVRVIATCNRDLEQAVADGQFRQDLFYRLNVIALKVPPLRDRREDILPLAEFFLTKYQRRDRPARRFAEALKRHLAAQPWNGNVRELENLIERACLLAREEEIQVEDLYPGATPKPTMAAAAGAAGFPACETLPLDEPITIEEMERRLILATLARHGGNRTRTADILGVSVRTIRNKLNEYGVKEVSCGSAG
jgi:DNA-binding NtrC family response regulator